MKNKYCANKVTINGEKFDSKKEANRYRQLLLMQKAGEIRDLQRQVPFILIPNQYKEVAVFSPKKNIKKIVKKLVYRKLEYIADFVYTDFNGNKVVEDVKGYRGGAAYTIFIIKCKLMYLFYSIEVKEV